MSSITWWNRLEPRPRSGDFQRALEARVRDAAWFLARQWQFGEFQGEDAASPAFVQVTRTTAPIVGWRVNGQLAEALPGQPLEETVETEAFSADLAVRVELGQTFEALVLDAGGSQAALQRFRAAYGFAGYMPGTGPTDPEGMRFSRVCAARALDGYLVYQALRAAAPGYPAPVSSLGAADQTAAKAALDKLKGWVVELYDDLGQGDGPAWRPERFE